MVGDKPTRFERATLVAQVAAGIMASTEAWRAFEHEATSDQTFEEWAIDRAIPYCKTIWSKLSD